MGGCLANFYQSFPTADGVCTACGDKGTLAAAAFGGTPTVCTCAAGYTGADCATHSCAGVAGKPTWSTVSSACVVAGSDDATCAAIDAAKPAWLTVSTACVAAGSTDATCAAISTAMPKFVKAACVACAASADCAGNGGTDVCSVATANTCVVVGTDDATCAAINAATPKFVGSACVAKPTVASASGASAATMAVSTVALSAIAAIAALFSTKIHKIDAYVVFTMDQFLEQKIKKTPHIQRCATA